MKQMTYDDHKKLMERQLSPKVILRMMIGAVVGIVVFVLVVVWLVNNEKNKECINLHDILEEYVILYLSSKEQLPNIYNPVVNLDISEVKSAGFINESEFSLNGFNCEGDVKVTFIGDMYLVTPNLTNCDYCTTDTKYGDFVDAGSVLPNKEIVDVKVTYNYVTKTTNYTPFSNYYTPSELEKNPFDSTDDVRFGNISDDAKNVIIIKDDKNYYGYYDKQWRFYKNDVAYSGFSSVAVGQYVNIDYMTQIETEYSQWTVNAIEEASYRTIQSSVGYRWYKTVDKQKVYYEGGMYLPKSDGPEGYTMDDKDSANVYRYKDKMWKWYANDKRIYSSYVSVAPSGYIYKDEDLVQMSALKGYYEESQVDITNSYYRTEVIEVRSRFRLQYDLYSFDIMPSYVDASEFLMASGGLSMEDVYIDEGYDLVAKYEYFYRK